MTLQAERETGTLVDPRLMRDVLGHVPTSVAVVCTLDDGAPAGCTIGSFVSVSLDPPLVAFFAMDSSSTLGAVKRVGSYTINVLAHDQDWICDVFARRQADRFTKVGWAPGRNDNPRLRNALAVLECDLESVTTVGDHEMVLGRVSELSVERQGSEPLVFAQGALRKLAPASPSTRHPLLTWLGDGLTPPTD